MKTKAAAMMVLLMGMPGLVGWGEEKMPSFDTTPVIVETGIRSGKVVDAVSGKGIEGAVVSYQWDVREFMIESHTRLGAFYEIRTDKEGGYSTPSQKISVTPMLGSNIKPEEVIVYKNGYIWYRVYDNHADSFMIYLPDLKYEYRKEGNLVKLQPWNEKMSHAEHIAFLTEGYPRPKGQLLQAEAEQEKPLAQQEKQTHEAFRQKVRKEMQNYRNDRGAYESQKITQEEYIARLHGYLQIPDAEMLIAAALELKKFGDISATDVMIDFLKDNVYRRESFSRVLGGIGAITGREDLKDSDRVPEREQIVEEFAGWWQRTKDKSETERIADLLLTGKNEQVKYEAINALRQTGDKSMVPYLEKFLERPDEDAGLYAVVMQMLMKYGDGSAIGSIKDKLYHKDVYVRRAAALALHKFGDQTGAAVMMSSLGAPSRNTRSVANAVLKEITGQDFTGGKSLRLLPPAEEKEAISKWQAWWQQNKIPAEESRMKDLSVILENEVKAEQQRLIAAREAEKKNPEYPLFEDPDNTPVTAFAKFKQALQAGKADEALSCIDSYKKGDFQRLFENMGPHLSDFADRLGEIYFSSKLYNVYYYEMHIETDEGISSYPIQFVPGDKGNWLIEDF